MNAVPYYTHAGFIHADEVAGYVTCRMAGVCSYVVRLTDLSNIPTDGVVSDIGRNHNPELRQFDHHQGFFPRSNGVPYASAGMIWNEYGEQAVENVLGINDVQEIQEIWQRVDETFIQGIDAHDADNAFKINSECSGGPVRVLTISNAVAMMNCSDPHNHEAQHVAFMEAASFIEKMLTASIRAAADFIEARRKFAEVAKVEGEIIILSEGLPWKEIVHEQHPNAKFVISPSNHPGSPWSMIAVPVEPESRIVKIPIERPKWFEGFIHQGKWIAGGKSVEELRNLAAYNLIEDELKMIASLGPENEEE